MNKKRIYSLVRQLGLKRNEIDYLIYKNKPENEQTSITMGLYPHNGTH